MTLTCIPCPHTHFVVTLNLTGVEANMFYCIVFKDSDFLFKIINCSSVNHKRETLNYIILFITTVLNVAFFFPHGDLQ